MFDQSDWSITYRGAPNWDFLPLFTAYCDKRTLLTNKTRVNCVGYMCLLFANYEGYGFLRVKICFLFALSSHQVLSEYFFCPCQSFPSNSDNFFFFQNNPLLDTYSTTFEAFLLLFSLNAGFVTYKLPFIYKHLNWVIRSIVINFQSNSYTFYAQWSWYKPIHN